jgi:hypothetical protein
MLRDRAGCCLPGARLEGRSRGHAPSFAALSGPHLPAWRRASAPPYRLPPMRYRAGAAAGRRRSLDRPDRVPWCSRSSVPRPPLAEATARGCMPRRRGAQGRSGDAGAERLGVRPSRISLRRIHQFDTEIEQEADGWARPVTVRRRHCSGDRCTAHLSCVSGSARGAACCLLPGLGTRITLPCVRHPRTD